MFEHEYYYLKISEMTALGFWDCNGQLRLFYPNMSFYVSITYLSYKKETISYVLLIIYITKCYFISFKFINIFLHGALLYSYSFYNIIAKIKMGSIGICNLDAFINHFQLFNTFVVTIELFKNKNWTINVMLQIYPYLVEKLLTSVN